MACCGWTCNHFSFLISVPCSTEINKLKLLQFPVVRLSQNHHKNDFCPWYFEMKWVAVVNKFMRCYLFISFACVQSPDLGLHCFCMSHKKDVNWVYDFGADTQQSVGPKILIRHNILASLYFRAKIAIILEARFLPTYYVYLSLIWEFVAYSTCNRWKLLYNPIQTILYQYICSSCVYRVL